MWMCYALPGGGYPWRIVGRRKITAIRGVDAVSSIAPLAWQQDFFSPNCAELSIGFFSRAGQIDLQVFLRPNERFN